PPRSSSLPLHDALLIWVRRPARPAPGARRQAAASAAANASCATARRRQQFLRKICAAANGRELKVKAREIRAREMRASAASAGRSEEHTSELPALTTHA